MLLAEKEEDKQKEFASPLTMPKSELMLGLSAQKEEDKRKKNLVVHRRTKNSIYYPTHPTKKRRGQSKSLVQIGVLPLQSLVAVFFLPMCIFHR